MVGRSLFLPPTTFPPTVLGEVSSSKLQATSQALKPQASNPQASRFQPQALLFPWPATSRFSSGLPVLALQIRRLPGTWDPATLAQAVKHVYQRPNAALTRARVGMQRSTGSHSLRGGDKLLEQFNHDVFGTSAPKAAAASAAKVLDGFAAAPAADDA
ncbi:hypothetical protein FB451DRAFT_1186507 [Mycena latifolia]|nr:hypothetical protein FB451DRAFT_1186507 [Mycena latifolia]